MPTKAVVDTNIWVSYFINERINYLIRWMLDHEVEICISDELIDEITEVLQRPKFSSRKSREDILDFIELLTQIGSNQKVKAVYKSSPDTDDNFLFDLCLASHAEFLITSDKNYLPSLRDLNCRLLPFLSSENLLQQSEGDCQSPSDSCRCYLATTNFFEALFSPTLSVTR